MHTVHIYRRISNNSYKINFNCMRGLRTQITEYSKKGGGGGGEGVRINRGFVRS